jgi:hypothetical protein
MVGHIIKRLLWIIIAICIMIVIAGVLGVVVLQLWNWLLPPLFGWHTITYWQAVGILILARLLFGTFGGRPWMRSNFRRRMHERWESMTPEEREKFRQGMRGRCGFGPTAPAESK